MILDDPWEPAEHREKRMNSAYFIVAGALTKIKFTWSNRT